jgi:hypothetical protein
VKLLLRKLYRWARNAFFNTALMLRRPRYDSKVFCVGFNKTGTTSLGWSLKMLGYRHSSYSDKVWLEYYNNNEIVKLLKYTAKFDSVDDLPWLKEDLIPVLDRVFPNSKFIYLLRDEGPWKKSIYNWTYDRFGYYPDIEAKLEEFRAHKKFVLDYFCDRGDDEFLILDIKDEMGFKKLADFLGKKTNLTKFPHYNKAKVVSEKKQ